MFTGLIEELGVVKGLKQRGNLIELSIEAEKVVEDLKIGDSIAINGACLTVIGIKSKLFSVDVSGETLEKTTLSKLKVGDRINLERPLRMGDRLGGHLISGHVDGVGRIEEKVAHNESFLLKFKAPSEFMKYMVPKGSIAVDGISLTIVNVDGESFSVEIIPHTAKVTTLGLKGIGDEVNLEVDLIGKYVESLKDAKLYKEGISRDFLTEKGFI